MLKRWFHRNHETFRLAYHVALHVGILYLLYSVATLQGQVNRLENQFNGIMGGLYEAITKATDDLKHTTKYKCL